MSHSYNVFDKVSEIAFFFFCLPTGFFIAPIMQLRIKAEDVVSVNFDQGPRADNHLTAMGRKKRLNNSSNKCPDKSAMVRYLAMVLTYIRDSHTF